MTMKSMPFFKMVSPQSRTACWLAASTTTSGLSFSSAFSDSTTATLAPTCFCVALARPGRTRAQRCAPFCFSRGLEPRLLDDRPPQLDLRGKPGAVRLGRRLVGRLEIGLDLLELGCDRRILHHRAQRLAQDLDNGLRRAL